MLRGNYKGEALGSGSDAWKYWDERRAGTIDEQRWKDVESGIARSYGHCMTFGTASTMTAIAEALGLTLPGASSIPAADANHIRMATQVGRRIVDMMREGLTPDKVLTRKAVDNAVTVRWPRVAPTNAVGAPPGDGAPRRDRIDARRFRRGEPHHAGAGQYQAFLARPTSWRISLRRRGLRALMSQLRDRLNLDALTVSGRTLGETLEGAEVYNADVIRPLDKPIYHEGSLAVLRGNIAPDGCVIKPSAASRDAHARRAGAGVRPYPEMKAAVEDDDLDVTADHILILRNAGPQGGPGMPEWGMLPIPRKLLKQGVRDMLRLSDARMSGTSYGACILHAAPEAHIGGPLALVRTGDRIRVDVPNRRIDMLVREDELARRRAAWAAGPRYERGYGWMYINHVTQADKGCDFDFLETAFGGPVAEPDIF